MAQIKHELIVPINCLTLTCTNIEACGGYDISAHQTGEGTYIVTYLTNDNDEKQ